MCDFVNIAKYTTTGLNIASAGMGVAQVLGQGIAQRNINRANNAAVQANYQAQMGVLTEQQRQVNQQAGRQKGSIAREAMARRATLLTAAGEGGVSGNTLASGINSVNQSANEAMTTIELNRQGRIAQSARDGQAMRADADGRMRDDSFDWFGSGLQIGREGLNLAKTFQVRKT